jgi:hypothetical protein
MSITLQSRKELNDINVSLVSSHLSESRVYITDLVGSYYQTPASMSLYANTGSLASGTWEFISPDHLERPNGEQFDPTFISTSTLAKTTDIVWNATSFLDGVDDHENIHIRQHWYEAGKFDVYSEPHLPATESVPAIRYNNLPALGNYYLSIPSEVIDYSGSSQITFEWWGMPTKTGNWAEMPYVGHFMLPKTTTTQRVYSYELGWAWLDALGNDVNLLISFDTGSVNLNFGNFPISLDPISSTWYHFAWTYEAGHQQAFVNGVRVDEKFDASSWLPPPNSFLRMGDWRAFAGSGDEQDLMHYTQFRFSNTIRYSGSFTPELTLKEDDDTVRLWNMSSYIIVAGEISPGLGNPNARGGIRDIITGNMNLEFSGSCWFTEAGLSGSFGYDWQRDHLFGGKDFIHDINVSYTSSNVIPVDKPYVVEDSPTASFNTLTAPVVHRNHFTLFYSTASDFSVVNTSSTQDDNFIVNSGTFSVTNDTFTSLSASNNFTGSGVVIPHSSSWDNLSEVSWNMWVKMSLPSTPRPLAQVRQTLTSLKWNHDQNFRIEYWKDTTFRVRLKSTAESGGARTTQGIVVMNDDNWHMATVTFNEDVTKIYVDNILINSSSYPSAGTFDNQNYDLNIGLLWAAAAGKWDYRYPLNGYIDEYSMWTKELTEDDIDTLWNDGTGSIIFPWAENDLLLYYTFPSRSDSNVLDERNHYDGTTTGSFLNYPSSSYYTPNSFIPSGSFLTGSWIVPLQTDWYVSGVLFPIKGAITADTVDSYFGGAVYGDDIFPVGTEKIEYRGLVTSNNEVYYLFISKSSHPYY